MLSIIIISTVASGLIVGYVLIVNKFLRGDEHYNDCEIPAEAPKATKPADLPSGAPAHI